MGKERIIEMYKKGFSIDYISRKYYKSINKNKKPIKINGIIILPTKIYNLSYYILLHRRIKWVTIINH